MEKLRPDQHQAPISRLRPSQEGGVQARLTKNERRKDPFAGTVFVFRARKADRLKLLCWDSTSLVMAYKRLEAHSFTWPAVKDGLMLMNHAQIISNT